MTGAASQVRVLKCMFFIVCSAGLKVWLATECRHLWKLEQLKTLKSFTKRHVANSEFEEIDEFRCIFTWDSRAIGLRSAVDPVVWLFDDVMLRRSLALCACLACSASTIVQVGVPSYYFFCMPLLVILSKIETHTNLDLMVNLKRGVVVWYIKAVLNDVMTWTR